MVKMAWLTFALLATVSAGCAASWQVANEAGVLKISYGTGTDHPQYAALHLADSYLRLVPSRTTTWGTSFVLMPCLWTGGSLRQGAPITSTPVVSGADLLIPFKGTIAGLQVQGQVRLSPPAGNAIKAVVSVTVKGTAPLDSNRPGEAFKPVMLSSMHVSATKWDTQSARVGTRVYPIPAGGWILTPPVSTNTFDLRGGTSAWNPNAPTVQVTLDKARPVTGWVTPSSDTSDDNVGLWASSATILPSWQYTVVAKACAPQVSAWSPKWSAVSVASNISATFDAPMNRATAQAAMTINGVKASTFGGAFSWSGKCMIFNPTKSLQTGTRYSVAIGTGAKSATGIGMVKAFTWSFQTKGVAAPPLVTAACAPTAQGAQITLNLASAADVTVSIRNLAGREVAALQPGSLPAGVQSLLWNAQTRNGTRAPAGRYLLQVSANAADGASAAALTSLQLR